MSTIEDLNGAIDDYANNHVEIDIINFASVAGDGHINVGEVWTFDVRVRNNGILDMKNFRLHVQGSTWSSVGNSDAGPFSGSLISSPQDVNAHSTVTFQPFYMRADAATGGGGTESEEIVKAHTSVFDADLEHLLRDHTHHSGSPEAAYTRHIHPD